jgi:ABC-2 type transport system ATP-binding protein
MDSINANVIQTQGLSKAYKGTKVLEGLNLNVPQNSIFGFLGPNGAGKSTTIKLLGRGCSPERAAAVWPGLASC